MIGRVLSKEREGEEALVWKERECEQWMRKQRILPRKRGQKVSENDVLQLLQGWGRGEGGPRRRGEKKARIGEGAKESGAGEGREFNGVRVCLLQESM